MKTNFSNKLFEKQIDVKTSNLVTGGMMQEDTSTITSECTDCGSDSRTITRAEDGHITQSCYTWK